MSRVDQIENQIRELSPEEMQALRAWLAAYDADLWDRQLESDAASGRLDRLTERALNDHRAGRSTRL